MDKLIVDFEKRFIGGVTTKKNFKRQIEVLNAIQAKQQDTEAMQ